MGRRKSRRSRDRVHVDAPASALRAYEKATASQNLKASAAAELDRNSIKSQQKPERPHSAKLHRVRGIGGARLRRGWGRNSEQRYVRAFTLRALFGSRASGEGCIGGSARGLGGLGTTATMGNAASQEPTDEEKAAVLGLDCSAAKVVAGLKDGTYTNVVVAQGAGVSVSCGIPDFRTPGTGLYDNLQRFNLPTPESVFELGFFQSSEGAAFYKLAREMWPDNFRPSPAHLFVRMLSDKGLLVRCFTQNIDTLERAAGVPDDKLVEAHGSFASSTCSQCSTPFDQATCKAQILAGDVPVRCAEPDCGGLVKPDIVFFGESLPSKFALCSQTDLPKADLLIVLGTSLTVHPFAGIVEMVGPTCPRLLLNMKPVGLRVPSEDSDGLRLNQTENYRDAMVQGPCDEAVRAMCDALGWREELEALVAEHGSKGGPSEGAVDFAAALPAMAPLGLARNWRLEPATAAPLPAREPAVTRPEEFELTELDAVADAEANASAMAFFLYEELTELRLGGAVAGMLCLAGDAHEAWEMSHVLALVPASATIWDMETIANCELLAEPMTLPGADKPRYYFQIGIGIMPVARDEGGQDAEGRGQYELWYVDTTRGCVTRRWGPISITEDGQGAEDVSQDVQDIVDAMGKMPADLAGPGD